MINQSGIAMDTKFVTLNTGAKMPIVGLGTYAEPGEIKQAVETAIDVGYRHLDCAFVNGNEAEIGEAIQNKIEDRTVKRKDLFITTKAWPTYYRKVRECFDESLRRLKLEYVDLYLMSWPFAFQPSFSAGGIYCPMDENGKILFDDDIHYLDVWRELEKLKTTGLAKAIGVSNFNEYQINRILSETTISPSVNQYEIHPYLAQENLLQYCKSKNIAVTGFSPLGAPNRSWQSPGEPKLVEDPKLQEIAKKHETSVAQVILRYQIQRGVIVIPKSTNSVRIKSNFAIFDFNLDNDDMGQIRTLDRNLRYSLPAYATSKYSAFSENYSE
uniref:aldo-keto reductase family 1 member B7-like n=1 Tax=Styela clava TaxID=7725 RepID=UPI00193A3354|nr:aldo-keto reductase family 1 member B7-like [Styela clava]